MTYRTFMVLNDICNLYNNINKLLNVVYVERHRDIFDTNKIHLNLIIKEFSIYNSCSNRFKSC